MPNLNYAMMNGCERAGIAGNCGSKNCPVLMGGDCDVAADFEDGLLTMLGIEDLYPHAKPDPYKQAEDAYDRAMSIL